MGKELGAEPLGASAVSVAKGIIRLWGTSKAESYLAKGQEVCEKTGYTPDALIMLPFLC